MKKQRLLIVVPHFWPYVGGIEESTKMVCERLSATTKITVLTSEYPNTADHEMIDGYEIKRVNSTGFRQIDFGNYDVILFANFCIQPHTIMLFQILARKLFKRGTKLKVILVPHGGFTIKLGHFGLLKSLFKILYHKLVGLSLVKFVVDELIAVSEWEASQLKTYGVRKPITIISNGVMTPKNVAITAEAKANKPYFIFVGRLHPVKNLEGILCFFKSLRTLDSTRDLSLVIMGKDSSVNHEYQSSLEGIVKELGLSKNVKFIGERKGVEKYGLIAGSEALICLSHHESDSIVVKEALAVQAKVIINDNDALADYHSGPWVYKQVQPNASENVFKFLAKPKVNKIKIASWDEVAQQYEKVILK